MNQSPSNQAAIKLTDFRHLNLFQAEVVTAHGSHPWIFASRKAQPLSGPLKADAVAMIMVVQDTTEPRLLVIREFRAPLGCHQLSLPAGLIDPGESVEVSAQRELFEETGLQLSRISWTSPPVASSAGLTDETVILVYGEATGTLSDQNLTPEESIEARLLTLAEIQHLLQNPGEDLICVRLYSAMIGFLTTGSITLPQQTN